MFETRPWLTQLLITLDERSKRIFLTIFTSSFDISFLSFDGCKERGNEPRRRTTFQSRRDGKADKKTLELRGQGWRCPVQKYRRQNEGCCKRENFSRAFSSSSRVARYGKRAAIKFTAQPRRLSCIYSWSFPRRSSRNFQVEQLCTSMIPLLLFPRLHWQEADAYN